MGATKGRLEAALERVRQRRLDAQRATNAVVSEPTPPRPAPSTPEQTTAPRRPPVVPPQTATARQSAILAMPRFCRVDYDREKCIAERILIGDGGTSNSAGAAAYRMLRTRILQRTRSNHWNTIGVTSPGPGEGKSVTALNLALAIAREGNNNVFLIDLDMRNPKMCQYLGAVPPRDITDYFTGHARPEDVLFSIGVDNLTLAGTLIQTDEASELLATGRVEELFTYIRGLAPEPLILVDLPPLLSTDDAIIVAPKVDASLLVLAEGKSRRDGAAKALELLSEFRLAGIILNRSHTMVTDYYPS